MSLFIEVPTAWGVFAVGATPEGISRVCFPGPDAVAALTAPSRIDVAGRSSQIGHAESASKALQAYIRGEPEERRLKLDFSRTTPFMRAVFETLMNVPRGVTISYHELAILAGHPGAARAVGSTMRKNRIPILVPCHRVVAAGHRLGGWSGPKGLKTKLLSHEGVDLDRFQKRGE